MVPGGNDEDVHRCLRPKVLDLVVDCGDVRWQAVVVGGNDGDSQQQWAVQR